MLRDHDIGLDDDNYSAHLAAVGRGMLARADMEWVQAFCDRSTPSLTPQLGQPISTVLAHVYVGREASPTRRCCGANESTSTGYRSMLKRTYATSVTTTRYSESNLDRGVA